MAIQDHLRRERRMPADLDGDVSPVTIENMKRVVIDIRLLFLEVIVRADVAHRRLGSTDQDQKQTLGDRGLGQVVFGHIMLALASHTVDDRNTMRFGIASHAPAEPAGQPHQMGVIKGVVRSSERPPPHAEAARTMCHPEIRIQDNAIHAVVAAAQQISIKLAQSVCHAPLPRCAAERRRRSDTSIPTAVGMLSCAAASAQRNCPAGATFPQRRLGKSVGAYRLTLDTLCIKKSHQIIAGTIIAPISRSAAAVAARPAFVR
jgi:hypothetical protein